MKAAVCLSIVFLFGTYRSNAATLYCSPSGGGSGADFNNLATLPNTTGFTRGNIYKVVDGTYGSKTLSTVVSGSTTITIQKVSASDSGVAGYSTTLHDGEATFSMTMVTGYWIIDGVTRTETTKMEEPLGYGFRISSLTCSGFSGDNGSGSVISYCNIGGTWNASDTPDCSEPEDIAYFPLQDGVTFNRCVFHNAGQPNGRLFAAHGASNMIWDHCDFYMGQGKAAIASPNVIPDDWVIRYCRFWNAARHCDCPDAEGTGITAEVVAISASGTSTGILFYGNIVYNSASGGRNSAFQIGEASPGPSAVNCVAYNNTFVGFPEDSVYAEVFLYGGSGNVIGNNLFYNCVNPSVSANTTFGTVIASSDKFVDYANRDFRLAVAVPGATTLDPPFHIAPDGSTRGADGEWDVGANEFNDGVPPVFYPQIISTSGRRGGAFGK